MAFGIFFCTNFKVVLTSKKEDKHRGVKWK